MGIKQGMWLVQRWLAVIGATTGTKLDFSDSSQDLRFSDLLLLNFEVIVGIFRLDSGDQAAISFFPAIVHHHTTRLDCGK